MSNKSHASKSDVRFANVRFVLHHVLGTTSSRPLKNSTEHAFYKALGARIRELRDAMSQEQLANAVSLTRTSIVNIEAGRQKLLLHNLFRIAEALGVRPTELLSSLESHTAELPSVSLGDDVADYVNRWVNRSVRKALNAKTTR